jgi:two-component system, OmpR family, sensor kinase
MIIALVVAEIVGTMLLVNRPPLHSAPVSLSELASRLGDTPEEFAGPPPGDLQGPPDFAPGGGPPLREPGPARASLPPDLELRMSSSTTPPVTPKRLGIETSGLVRNRLAALLQVDQTSIVVYVEKDGVLNEDSRRIGSTTLREGFVVARHLDDGTWRVLESMKRPAYALQKQALLLFAIGLLILLPLAWLFSRALSIPIVSFSHAAKRLGADPNAPPLPVEGPKEMLSAIESFNAMQARLNSLLQERTQMIAAIAHDLRTPLTRLAFRLDDLPSPLNEKVSADIQEMKSMISAALDFIRDRTLSTRRERLDFRLLVESVVDDQTDLGRDVSFVRGSAVTVIGDPLALRRVVMNIVDNAIKYGTRARLQLGISQHHCVLDVDDDGPGITEALQQRVFEPFYRLENSRNRDTGGVGLGLAVVRATILDHGGDVRLSNPSSGGLRVTITLPLASS